MRAQAEPERPGPDDVVEIGMMDTAAGDRWIRLGGSRAWCWQQGCMLQWRPGSESDVVWNDREGDRFVARVCDTRSGDVRTVPRAIYALSPDGRWAVATDFRRLSHCRPGYGYEGVEDPQREQPAPSDSGLWRVDLASGEERLLLSLADAAGWQRDAGRIDQERHWFNHLLISPDGRRVEFLHRWSEGPERREGQYKTRMLVVDSDGSDLRLIDDSGDASHFIWDADSEHILVSCSAGTPGVGPGQADPKASTRQLCRIAVEDRRIEVEDTAQLPHSNGHFTLLPGTDGRWMLTDFCGKPRSVYLHDRRSGRALVAATLPNVAGYGGPFRVDLHPRSDRRGRAVFIDSPHEGRGRQIYRIDIDEVRRRKID